MPRRHAASRDGPRRRTLHRAGRIRRVLERLAAARSVAYVAVCGRRDAVLPRNVQKDPKASLTWALKDEIMTRGKVYYAKLARGKAMFLAPRMIPYSTPSGACAGGEKRLSEHARAILRVLRKEWEMGTSDLRAESGVNDRAVVHQSPRRTPGRDDRDTECGLLPAEVHLHLVARRRSLSGRADPARARTSRCGKSPAVPDGAGMTFAASSPASRACHGPKPDAAIARWSPKATRRCSNPACIVWPPTPPPRAD